MFEYAPFACGNKNCEMHGQIQYRAWERSHTTHLHARWLSHNACQICNRVLTDYTTHMRNQYQDTGYMPPMINMRCANPKCDRYGADVPQNYDAELARQGIDWYHGDDGMCPECARGMMTDVEWAQWRS